MGFDTSFCQFLLGARASGVSFENCLTIGRQEFFPKEDALGEMLHKFGMKDSASDLLARSKGYSEPFLTMLGAKKISSLDASAYEGADIVADMNNPIGDSVKERFSVVIDGGSIEHIFNIPVALKNMMELVEVGGHFMGVTCGNNYSGHGFYQLSPEWAFRAFTPANGFEIQTVMMVEPLTKRLRFYSVDDPAKIGTRSRLVNKRQALLMVLAKKVSVEKIFATPPQQSDYVVRWTDTNGKPAGNGSNGKANGNHGARQLPRAVLRAMAKPLPEPIKSALRRCVRSADVTRMEAKDFRRYCYHEIAIEEMARGRVCHTNHAS